MNRMESLPQSLRDQISELLKPHRVCLVTPVSLNSSSRRSSSSSSRFMVLSLWRGYVLNKQPVKVESSFSYLEICSIDIHSLTQVVLQTDRQTLSFSVLHILDLEAMVSHMTSSLKRIFPDSSPGKLLKTIPPEFQQRFITLTTAVEQQLNTQPGSCGGFSDTYAALCDFNEIPLRAEIQWDVDNIYFIHCWRRFNLQDFSHLDSRDLAIVVAALSFNQWFTNIYSRELKLSADVQQQLTFLLSRSPCLKELTLESCGLKMDFAVKMAAALCDHASSVLQTINLSGNAIEDRGVIALSQELGNLSEGLTHLSLSRVNMTAKGLGYLSQVLSTNQLFSLSLTHLDLSGNPGSLVTEDATFLFKFLSSTNSLSHLDLSDTNCPLDTLFVSLSAGCCFKLMHVNLARNPFSHRKLRGVTRSIHEFFSQSYELRYVGLSATKLPPQALRLLLQGLATNNHLCCGLELDLSSCELRSAGAQVIQEHISEASVIRTLDISDNGFENDMVTLVLSLGRCHSLKQLALGRNFNMKSRALTDVLQRIAQLIQDDECPLQALSVRDSRLRTGMDILLSALGGHAALSQLDITGNHIGDHGAKMLSKALLTNTRLRTLMWDRNNVTSRGFRDVADALERNFTLQQVSLPLADITHCYRSNPDRTREALHKIQQCLDRNNQSQCTRAELQQVPRTHQSEKLVQGQCRQLEDSLKWWRSSMEDLHPEVLAAHEVLTNATESLKLFPALYEAGRDSAPDGDMVNCILTHAAAALTDEFTRSIQELAQGLMRCAEEVCPRAVQRSSVCECVSECVSKRSRQTHTFLNSTLVENMGHIISSRLRELRQTLSDSLAESISQQLIQDLKTAQGTVDSLIEESSSSRILSDQQLDGDFPTDDYSPALWRNSFHSVSLRPAPSVHSLLEADWDPKGGRGGGGNVDEAGGGGSGFLRLSTATPLSVSSSSPSPSPPVRRGWREVVDAAAAAVSARGASSEPPPPPPPAALPLSRSPLSAPAPEAAGRGPGGRRAPAASSCTSSSTTSSMEPLPTQGTSLRHYTASRPRPRRTHTQPPSSRTQEAESKAENDVSEGMGRVDEGVEEFFTKKIIPDYALKGRWEESHPAQAPPPESSSTPFSSSSDNITSSSPTVTSSSPTVTSSSVTDSSSAPTDTSSAPTDTSSAPTDTSSAPTDTSSLTSSDIPSLPTSSPPPTSSSTSSSSTSSTLPTKNIKKKFGDFFAFKRARAGRAAKVGGAEGSEVKVKRTSIADLIRPLREAKDRERGARSGEDANVSNDAATTEGTAASRHLAGDARETAVALALAATTPPSDAAPSSAAITTTPDPADCQEEPVTSLPVPPGRIPSPVATLPLMKAEVKEVREVKEVKEGGTPSGERRLKVTKRSLREGKSQSLILLTGSEPDDKDPHGKKHVSESTSSFEQRLQVMLHRMGVAKSPPADTKMNQNKDEELRKANSEGAILDKPRPPPTSMKPRTMSTSSADPRHPLRALDPVRPDPPLLPKPTVPDRPAGPLPPKPAVAAKPPLPTAPRPSSAPPSSCSAERVQLRPQDHLDQPEVQDAPSCSRRDLLPPSAWRPPSTQQRSEKAQSATDESLPKPRPHLKPLPQRRAVSVHEDTLAMTQELKAVLQKSPIRFRSNRVDLPTCSEDPTGVEKGRRPQEDRELVKPPAEDKGAELKSQHEASAPRLKAPPTLEKPITAAQDRSPGTATASLEKTPASPEKNLSTISPDAARRPDRKTSPGRAAAAEGYGTKERGEAVCKQHTIKTEPTDQRTEPPPSE